MTLSGHATTFDGLPVHEYRPGEALTVDPAKTAFAVRLDWDDYDSQGKWMTKFEVFIADEKARLTPALVVGVWDFEYGSNSSVAVEALVKHADKLPNLRALFLGDIEFEEQEMSWIEQSDVGPLLAAFPNLETFKARGGNGLMAKKASHNKLKTLIIETGGLGGDTAKDFIHAGFPMLEHLELWLGDEHYGNTTTVDSLRGLYAASQFPRLKYLGLRNAMNADDVATYFASAPVLSRLETFDLSNGALGDDGALALLMSKYVQQLKRLNLRHHFISDAFIEKLRALPDVDVDVSDPQESENWRGETWRFIVVSE